MRPGRDGPERSGGRAAVPGREQSHPLRQSKGPVFRALFLLAVQEEVWSRRPKPMQEVSSFAGDILTDSHGSFIAFHAAVDLAVKGIDSIAIGR